MTLSAFARPIRKAAGVIDHTYATGPDERVWPCFGSASGGRPLVSGAGDPDLADCYSRHESEAGIHYGVTGVCHQATNRIIAPCGRVVSEAPHFMCSSYVWGHYGFDWDEEEFGQPKPDWVDDWLDRLTSCGDSGFAGPRRSLSGGSLWHNLVRQRMKLRAYTGVVLKTLRRLREQRTGYAAGAAEVRRQIREEVRLMLHFRLHPEQIRKEGERIVAGAEQLYEQRVPLVQALVRGESDARSYAADVNSLVETTLDHLRGQIRAKTFVDFFGIPYSAVVQLVDPDIAETRCQEPVMA